MYYTPTSGHEIVYDVGWRLMMSVASGVGRIHRLAVWVHAPAFFIDGGSAYDARA